MHIVVLKYWYVNPIEPKNSNNMATPLFHEFKKQASFFFKEKFKSARLALTDVTLAELMTVEATNGKSRAPDSPTLKSISRAAFEIDDYWRIVEILHKRLVKFDKKNWRASYNSLSVLEHLLIHGPASSAEEFQCDKNVIRQMIYFQHTDNSGFNWGLAVKKKAERVLKLLEEGIHLKEERNRARRLSRGIQGFGSMCQSSTPKQGIQRGKSLPTTFDKNENKENKSSCSNNSFDTAEVKSTSLGHQGDNQMLQKSKTISKENKEKFNLWNLKVESNPFLDGGQEDFKLQTFIAEDDHPFNSTEMRTSSSRLSFFKMKQV